MSEQEAHRRNIAMLDGLELDACPFCGATNLAFYEHVYSKQFAVMCNLCGSEGARRPEPKEAGRMWNRRVQA